MGALIGAADLRLACLIVLAVETAMRREELASGGSPDLNPPALFLLPYAATSRPPLPLPPA